MSERYTADADAYRDLWVPFLRPLGERLLHRLPLAPARTVLDVGTGVGSLLNEIRSRSPHAAVIGVDPSRGMLANVDVQVPLGVMDGCRLGLRSQSVDVAVLAFVLANVPDPAMTLAEIRRILRPGGVVGLATWGACRTLPVGVVWEQELVAHGAAPIEPVVTHDGTLDTPDKMSVLMREAGFRSVSAHVESHTHHWRLDPYVAVQTRLFASRRRLEQLPARDRARCIRNARRRLGALESNAFVDRFDVVLTVAGNDDPGGK